MNLALVMTREYPDLSLGGVYSQKQVQTLPVQVHDLRLQFHLQNSRSKSMMANLIIHINQSNENFQGRDFR
jgi:hypothetical protein